MRCSEKEQFVLNVKAYGKINLTLEILGRRSDGYHNIVSIMQTISMYDELSFDLDNQLSVYSNNPRLDNQENVIFKAATLLKSATGYPGGAKIYLQKHIPMDSGLGGGSTDAASTLLTLSELWGVSLGTEKLLNLAIRIGSDVPFFLSGGTAMVSGTGDRICGIDKTPNMNVVILTTSTNIENKTATMYRHINPDAYTDGTISEKLMHSLLTEESMSEDLIHNAFSEVAVRMVPNLRTQRQALIDAGANNVHLTGSGPSLYSVTSSSEEAQLIAGNLKVLGHEAYTAFSVKNARNVVSTDNQRK